jgi:hypothetical protein
MKLRITIFNDNLFFELKFCLAFFFLACSPLDELALVEVLFSEERVPKNESLFVSYYFSKTIKVKLPYKTFQTSVLEVTRQDIAHKGSRFLKMQYSMKLVPLNYV